MLEWDITEKEALPAPEEAVPPPPTSKIGFYVVMGVIVLVAIVAVGWVGWRFREREVLLTADLLGQIRAEETARRVGNRDRIPDLIAPGIARSWRDDYISQFRTPDGESHPVEVTIEKVEYNGVQAQVWVRLGAQVQRRAYEQTSLGWRRVPLIINARTFGDSAILAASGTEFAHQRSDDQFVIQLAADLPRLEEAILVWANDPDAEAPPPHLLPLRIVIQPQENRPALLESIEPRAPLLTVNSPQVVALPAEWTISGDSAVRLAVAHMVWEQLPPSRINSSTLPGGNRFVNALQTVVGLRWALTPEEYTALTTQWQAQAKESSWQSPFFSLTLGGGVIDPFASHAQTSVLLLVADQYVASMEDEMAGMAETRARLATAPNWDEFFTATTGKSTLEFEASVRGIPAPAALLMPFTATLAPLAEDTSNVRGFAVTVEGQTQPIAVEALLGIADVTLPNGEKMNAGCAALFGELEIEGTWRENGLRLTPTRLQVNKVALPTTFTHLAPPADTVAYVANYSDAMMSNSTGIAQLSALTSDGTLAPVLIPDHPNAITLNPSGWGTADSSTGVLLTTVEIPYNCNAQWLIRYVPAKGITGAWFIQRQDPNAYLMPRWDDVSGRGMVVEMNNITPPPAGSEMPFWWLDEGEPRLLSTPDGYLPAGVSYLLAPHATSVMVYQMEYPNTNRTAISLIDTNTFTEQAMYTPPFAAYYGVDFAFSADGAYLYLAWQVPGGANNNAGEGTVVQAVEVATGKVQEWWSAEEGTIYFLAPDAQASFVYALTFAPQASQGIRLVKLTPDGSNLLSNGGDAFGISLVRRCASGGLLYLRLDTPTEQETRYELDPRYLHIVNVDASGNEQNRVFPLSTVQVPVLCP